MIKIQENHNQIMEKKDKCISLEKNDEEIINNRQWVDFIPNQPNFNKSFLNIEKDLSI